MNIVSPLAGIGWLRNGAQLIRRQPLRLLTMGLILQVLTGIGQTGPLGLLLLMALPALVAGFLQALHVTDRNGLPAMGSLFVSFQSTSRMLRLFLFSFLIFVIAMFSAGALMSGALQAIDPDVLARLEQGDLQALQSVDPQSIQQLAFSVLVGLIAAGVVAFLGIPLIWFAGYPVGKALFTGIVAIIRNVVAFVLLLAVLFALAIPVGMLVTSAYMVGGGNIIINLLILFLVISYQVLIYATQYCAYRDIFGFPDASPDQDQTDDQLVA